jgi:hypothetical protein
LQLAGPTGYSGHTNSRAFWLPAANHSSADITEAMKPDNPRIRFSAVEAEQEAAFHLFRGFIGWLKNPRSHRYVDTDNRADAFEIMALASYLMRRLNEATPASGCADGEAAG